MAPSLHFRPDGRFTIAQFTDLHWKDGSPNDLRTRSVMQTVLKEERPDLVVFTGDTIYTGYPEASGAVCTDPVRALKDAVSVVEAAGVPWAYIFGNHDAESLVTREQLMEAAMGQSHCFNLYDPEADVGIGNFVLKVDGRDGLPAAALFCFDTGIHSPLPGVEGYCWLGRRQIDWYVRNTGSLPLHQDGRPVPALAFLHIPLPEYREVWDTQVCFGEKYEPVCSPKINSGMFAAMLEAGNMMGTFAGHDHVNDYWGELHGIRLCYGRSTGHHSYSRDGYLRGARIIRLSEGTRSFETWLRLEDGTAVWEQPRHLPESR